MFNDSIKIISLIFRYKKVIIGTTKNELKKRNAGSVFGLFWLMLQPFLLLSVYLFVYLVVFNMSIPGYSRLDYVIFVFSGLVPFIGFSEAVQSGALSIKQNMHLIKNVMLPIEIVPIRAVLTALTIQSIMLVFVIALSAVNGTISASILALPLALLLQFIFLLGLVFIFSAIALVFQDILQFINLAIMLLMFLSPIGFRADMLSSQYQILIWGNPITYMLDTYRFVLMSNNQTSLIILIIFLIMALVIFGIGSFFFEKFKSVLVEYE